MALTIDKGEPKGSGMHADRRLFVDVGKARLVEDGSPDAAYLLAPEGGEILAADVERLGLSVVDGCVVQGAAEPVPEPEPEAEPEPSPQEETPSGARRTRRKR